jgi:hypothetical protein
MLKRTILAATVAAAAWNVEAAKKEKNIALVEIGTYKTEVFDEGAAEIVAHDPDSQRLFVINADAKTVDILDISDPTDPRFHDSIDVSDNIMDTGGVNSVAVKHGIVGVAVEHDDKQVNGWAAFYDTDGNYIAHYGAGALPDAITFTHNGSYALVANEGEPSDDYGQDPDNPGTDPEGSVTIIDLRGGVGAASVSHAGFTDFNVGPMDPAPGGVRAPRPFGATIAQDLEPEFIATSRDSKTAWVAMQENNGLAVVDIPSATVTALVGLGNKDHSVEGNGLDASNKADDINIQPWPILGTYMPDGIYVYRVGGNEYIVTANEGDGREYFWDTDEDTCTGLGFEYDSDDGCLAYTDETRVKDVSLNPANFANLSDFGVTDIAELQQQDKLGRLKMLTTEGHGGDDEYEEIHSFGARSITIWDTNGNVVWDSGDIMEQVTAMYLPDDFNSTNDENDTFKDRSDDKGPEPENVVVGRAFGRQYAFVGLERVGGIMVFDISDPANGRYVAYHNNRDFSAENNDEDGNLEGVDAGDLGPEGIAFIKAEDSPNGEPLLVVGNEVSGSTTIWQIVKD